MSPRETATPRPPTGTPLQMPPSRTSFPRRPKSCSRAPRTSTKTTRRPSKLPSILPRRSFSRKSRSRGRAFRPRPMPTSLSFNAATSSLSPSKQMSTRAPKTTKPTAPGSVPPLALPQDSAWVSTGPATPTSGRPGPRATCDFISRCLSTSPPSRFSTRSALSPPSAPLCSGRSRASTWARP